MLSYPTALLREQDARSNLPRTDSMEVLCSEDEAVEVTDGVTQIEEQEEKGVPVQGDAGRIIPLEPDVVVVPPEQQSGESEKKGEWVVSSDDTDDEAIVSAELVSDVEDEEDEPKDRPCGGVLCDYAEVERGEDQRTGGRRPRS